VRELGGGFWVVVVCQRSVLLRMGFGLGGVGWTAAGTWRAGAGMEFWSLWVARTIRLRFADFALSLGRSRLRFWGMGAYRRLRWLRAEAMRAAASLLATLFWLRVVRRKLASCARMLVRGFPITWCLRRLLFWIVFRCRRTGSWTEERCLGRSFAAALGVLRARRRRSCCAGCLRRFWGSSGLGLRTTFLSWVDTRCLRRV